MPFEEHPKAAEQAEDDVQVHALHAENSSQVQLLKDLLLQQTRRSEQLGKQAAARDWERWELLQLLRQKDEQLEFEETAAAKQRVVLNGARAGARHYRAVCCLRAWRSHVQQLCAERALLRAKNKQAVARLRHAGSLLHMVLKHVLNRQLKSGMHHLWLHASMELAVPAEKRKDESGFVTPRKTGGTLQRVASPSWDSSPLMRIPASEVSTEIPSRDGGRSSSSSGWQGASGSDPVSRLFKPDAVAAARLVINLQSMVAQRLFWSVGEWKRHLEAQEASWAEQQRIQSHLIWEQQAAEQAALLLAERSELLCSLEAAKSSQEVAAQHAANKVRKSLLEAWGRDRGKWAQERAKLAAAAERAEEEAKSALLAAQSAEADAAAKARCAMEAEKVARAKLQGEESMCTQLAAELRERIKQAESIEADLEWRLEEAKAQAAAPSSPELQELDSYAELVESLRSEVAIERAQRQASAKSLSALRNSYRLLLQRTSADGREGVRGLESLRGECRSMPTSFVVH